MAKIDTSLFLNPGAYAGAKTDAKKTKDKAPAGKIRFSGLLERLTQSSAPAQTDADDLPFSEETVKILLDDIHSAGDVLKNRPLPEEIKQYKQAVKRFLRYIVQYGYTAAKQVSGKNLLKRKNFTIVQVVDTKLEQLAAGILAGQTTQLEILRRLEEITGLLVDLLH
ncbi:MAG: DUF327 family protein [Spirochaetaceae bacterium]|jgi:uncharacterized protein YaaR (DUF327 family)|nr:DUF327 family protein [Spirochaetaceae bacterium]